MKIKRSKDRDDFISQLLSEIPEFQPYYDEHMIDMRGELLPFLLLADFTRFVKESYRKSGSGLADSEYWGQVVERSLNLMEHAMGSSKDVQELIILSFVENLLSSEGS